MNSGERGTAPAVKAYGHTRAWDSIIGEEADVIRDAAARAIVGERLAVIVRDLRRRGIPAPHGGQWTDATLGRILRNPRLVGDRAYHGKVVARDCWPAILDRETFARLQLAINHPSRQGAPPRHHKRLATGVARCGLCGQNLSTTTRNGHRYYSCPTQPTGCGRIHVQAERLESWLLDQLAARLHTCPPPAAVDTEDTAAAMAELCRDYYVSRIITRAAFLSARALLVRHADEASRQRGHQPELAHVLAAANPRRELAQLPLATLRQVVADRLDHLLVSPAVAKGPFDPRRLRCNWLQATLDTPDP